MQQFVVPQFIDVEDKIFGPVTTRQFMILLAAGMIVFLAFRFGDLAMFAVVLSLVGGGALVLAFVKVNGQSFHFFLLNLFQTLRKPSRRVWKIDYSTTDLNFFRKAGYFEKEEVVVPPKRESRRRIRDLSLVVNTGGFYQADEDDTL